MFIRKRRGWEMPESMATPEALVFNRRGLLKTVGAAALIGGIAGCGDDEGMTTAQAGDAPEAAPAGDPSAALYPFKRNAKYMLDRDLTAEKIVASYNNYYEFGGSKNIVREAQRLKLRPWQISIEGMVEKPFKIDIDALMKRMPLEERLYRHRCVEAWSFAAPWSGFPLSALVDLAKPTQQATYVVFKTFQNPAVAPGQKEIYYPWPYTEGLTMPEARNELAFLVTGAYGKPLAKQNGAPIRLAVPWKYGFKSIKGIQRIIFTNKRPVSYWESLQNEEYGFWANVNPQVSHPRWSQASEELLGTGKRVPTQLYNGYGEYVAALYANMKGETLYR